MSETGIAIYDIAARNSNYNIIVLECAFQVSIQFHIFRSAVYVVGIWFSELNTRFAQVKSDFNFAGYGVIVLDAAVLLEAGWDDMVSEVWTTVIPTDEASLFFLQRRLLRSFDLSTYRIISLDVGIKAYVSGGGVSGQQCRI